jgi:2,4-dienoyl-CoA reductase-like NADH-dependent reductase (Old Yellow Enzyme family)/thioredoxin reductase
MMDAFSALFQPLVIGRGKKKLTLKNRMVMAPMVTNLANSLAEVTRRMVDYYAKRAQGGVGTVVVEAMDIAEPVIFPRLGIFHDRFIHELEPLAAGIKENGAAAVGQIYHPGLRGRHPGPDDLAPEQIGMIIEAFGRAADRLKRAGFDGVMIHGAHGYLISSFLSPLTNRRNDAYGGDQQRRARFAADIIRTVRKAVGEDFPIFFRMNVQDYLPGGYTTEDARITAPLAEAAGADVIAIGGGVGSNPHNPSLGNMKSYGHIVIPMYTPRGYRVELGAQIKQGISVPLSISGRINDPHLAREIIAAGKADLVDLGRQLIADPFFPQKIAEGKIEEIRQCIACNFCIGKRMSLGKQIQCAINPWAGRESELREVKTAAPSKKITVVGAGVAGMEAARWLVKRGHRVSLYEKSPRLGGQISLAALPPGKGEMNTFLEFLRRGMHKPDLEVHLNREVTAEWLVEQKPGAVVIAIGGKPLMPKDIPLNPKMRCLSAWEVLSGPTPKLGEKVVVLGGGFVGAEVAQFMGEGKMAGEIAVVEMREGIALDLEAISRELLLERLREFGVKMITHFRIQEVTASHVIGWDGGEGRRKEIPAETVVAALGAESAGFPVEKLKEAGIPYRVIGDAREPRGIAEAVREGFLAGISI